MLAPNHSLACPCPTLNWWWWWSGEGQSIRRMRIAVIGRKCWKACDISHLQHGRRILNIDKDYFHTHCFDVPSQWACVAYTLFHIGDWLSRVTLSLSASCVDLARLLTCLLRPRLASQSWDCVHLAASDDNLRMVELYTILSRYKILFLEHGMIFLWFDFDFGFSFSCFALILWAKPNLAKTFKKIHLAQYHPSQLITFGMGWLALGA